MRVTGGQEQGRQMAGAVVMVEVGGEAGDGGEADGGGCGNG